jgi:hypothetical protein
MTKYTMEAARFPDFPPLTLLQVEQLQWYCASKMAVTNHAISNTWMKKTKRCDLLCDLWNHVTISALERSFEAHLYNTAE